MCPIDKLIIGVLIVSFSSISHCHNKYSAEANVKKSNDDVDFRPVSLKHLDKPFRMAKLNLLWSKAVVRLSEPKLKSLFGELKLHDKEEITWKHLKAEGKDKDGLKEAELRKKLLTIMGSYNLLDQADDVQDPSKYRAHKPLNEASDKYINKSLFKDKKLNKLWEKAETAGFTAEELAALKEEFTHHQDKVDQYYALLHDVKGKEQDDNTANSVDDGLDKFNTIESLEEPQANKDYLDKVNLLREQHKDIRDGYDRLHLLAAKGPNSKEFVEPKVQGLWKIAIESNFKPDELESLRVELLHYENRLLKLRHLQAEAALKEDLHKKKMEMAGGKTNGMQMMEDTIKKHARKVEKIHLDLETRIMQRHIEL
ncbi:alpha-2-macroglobulin receptor-associated protein [Tribolium castaneum]|uniref:Alpha-2-macroglobulin receptor-associated protein-like Protein n=1 Tax=Tribolium castaneum TaxID=7070 RepID=D6W9S8_TRICA|nr:PREDICTED: alpha-2-macroglobulin receptor-associated protein [Tribolium castaneum]EEZ98539.1 Alpha-2-macroglobulin receptor-associated protein-like Protein [Tribolium castaneum]|eukprot:XP_008201165.1 PREDICTED: alpha-2-macroglobulin receptor-associated protein [Tribolium castaneum]